MKAEYIDFFMGANTPVGFVSRYDQISQDSNIKKIYVIKGGAGTGKSTLMKKIGEACSESGGVIERIHCSSDPDSLDCVMVGKRGFAILDGTPPHPMEPQYPGAFEKLVNLYPCWDEEKLEKSLDEIKSCVAEYTGYHKKACNYLYIVASLLKSNMLIAQEYTDYDKINRYVNRIVKKEFLKASGEKAEEKIRFFSAVTPKGVKFYDVTAKALCDKIYVIEDDIGAVSKYMLGEIRKAALSRNFSIISGYCVTSPHEKLEHIIIPKLKLAFLTSNKFHRVEYLKPQKRVKASNFTDVAELNNKKNYITFNKKASKSFLEETVRCMQEAKKHHDALESFYIPCVDFDEVNKIQDGLLDKLNIKKSSD